MKLMQKEGLNKLRFRLINEGYNQMDDGYPSSGLWMWLKITHPEIGEAYMEWFDKEVRGKKL